ncbi:MAG: hypothetical protein ACLFPD_10730 [Desulfosudaceae bacterium]
MYKQILIAVALAVIISLPAAVLAAEDAAGTYSETLPQSAFDQGDAAAAIQMLVKEKVPVSEIMATALRNEVSHTAIVNGLLKAGVAEEEVIFHVMQGPMPSESALRALADNGISPRTVLGYVVQWENSSGNIYETCNFMLQQGYSKSDLLGALKEEGANRNLVVQVVRWFNIPPATVVAVYQGGAGETPGEEATGYMYSRKSMPQPAMFEIGVSRIGVAESSNSRGGRVISPIQP